MNAVNMTSGSAGAMDKRSGILYPLMLIAAVAVIVFSISGIATMMGWMPSVLSRGAGPMRAQPAAAVEPRPAAVACRECGVVESVRAVEESRRYEIRVRMGDGTSRTLYEATRPGFTVGQKVRVTHQGLAAAG
ncbi:MAG TPA: hypothetical protein VH881_14410 [Burkholderiales bacterium]|jgi:hypothetical protein